MNSKEHAARVGLLGVGFDANSSFRRGPARAPAAVREALGSESANAYSETGFKVWPSDRVHDHGDLDIPAESGERRPIDLIEKGCAEALAVTPTLVSLGGDHAVTYPLVRAFVEHYGRISLLHFDAHPDMYPDFEGNPYSHASPFARILEDGLVDRLVQVGIRSYSPASQAVSDQYGVEVIPAFAGDDVPLLSFDAPTYISIDIDALDPAFAPGVSHPEPGGLSVRQILEIIAKTKSPGIVGGDVVEFNPATDVGGQTAYVAAKFARELLGRLVAEAGRKPDL